MAASPRARRTAGSTSSRDRTTPCTTRTPATSTGVEPRSCRQRSGGGAVARRLHEVVRATGGAFAFTRRLEERLDAFTRRLEGRLQPLGGGVAGALDPRPDGDGPVERRGAGRRHLQRVPGRP